MLLDLKRGRKCEIDFITGAVSAAGRRLNVPTPYCDKITEIVHGIENGIYETSEENADFYCAPKRISIDKGRKSDIIYNETKNALFRRGCGIEEKERNDRKER